MECKCNWVEAILAIVIIIFAYSVSDSSKWVVIIAGILLLLHALFCKMCGKCEHMDGKSTMKNRRR